MQTISFGLISILVGSYSRVGRDSKTRQFGDTGAGFYRPNQHCQSNNNLKRKHVPKQGLINNAIGDIRFCPWVTVNNPLRHTLKVCIYIWPIMWNMTSFIKMEVSHCCTTVPHCCTTVQYFHFVRDKVPGLFVPKIFRSQERIVPMGNFRSGDFSFPGTFVLWERKFPRTFVPGPFRSREFSKVPGNFRSWDLSYPGTFVPIIR